MSSTTSSVRSDLSILAEQLSMSALESIALRHAHAETVVIQTPPSRGSFNLVYTLIFSDGRKWVARIRDPVGLHKRSMQSMLDTVALICQKTTIPIPVIHAHDTSTENELGAPYMLMDFADGVPLGDIWKDPSVVDDGARRRIFEQIAGYMSQLKALEFDKIGLLEYDRETKSYTVGPYIWDNYNVTTEESNLYECGPFTTTHAFFSHILQLLMDSPGRSYGLLAFLRIFALSLPDPKYDGAPFVLAHPDLDSQNVLIDPETLVIKAFIDWDDVCVVPRLGGFAGYPSWITRDWDPYCYAWKEPDLGNSDDSSVEDEGAPSLGSLPVALESQDDTDQPTNDSNIVSDVDGEPASDTKSIVSRDGSTTSSVFVEESPATLKRHRDLYLSIYSAIDPQNAEVTRQSEIYAALSNILHMPPLVGTVLPLIFRYVFDKNLAEYGLMVPALEDGDWFKSMERPKAVVPSRGGEPEGEPKGSI